MSWALPTIHLRLRRLRVAGVYCNSVLPMAAAVVRSWVRGTVIDYSRVIHSVNNWALSWTVAVAQNWEDTKLPFQTAKSTIHRYNMISLCILSLLLSSLEAYKLQESMEPSPQTNSIFPMLPLSSHLSSSKKNHKDNNNIKVYYQSGVSQSFNSIFHYKSAKLVCHFCERSEPEASHRLPPEIRVLVKISQISQRQKPLPNLTV